MRTREDSVKLKSDTAVWARDLLEKMRFFYELFPYPNRPFFLRPDPSGSLEAHAGFSKLLASEPSAKKAFLLSDVRLSDVRHAFGRNKRIALVGCGTDEPLLFRLLHPHNPIVGIDLSARSLKKADQKLRWHQQKDVELIAGDACAVLAESGSFSHIQCFGVLHHQPQPRDLFSAMAKSLELAGTLRVMIYSRSGRRLERGLQRKLLSWSTQANLKWLSLKLLMWRLCLPFFARRALASRFRYLGYSRSLVADALLHPSDHPLKLTDLLAWAPEEKLQLVAYRAKTYDSEVLSSFVQSPASVETLVSEEERGNISSNIVLVFQKVG